ncbi:MAG: hypothetical protein K6U88_09170 [Dehalococcoidia bacterium]|uniref:Uncharacterized protein n=2 Tax=Tepidiforma TaxID=2682228 RepID=A0ABX6C3I5_9CHLR|nr:hypothetical protein [Tepidiforma bonchosmolovskayae]MCL6645126.1 hypothetical protein [Dehalococcoidia bacterium]QFG03839.1 hypothetical protein Tbon_11220 [Tepidiforma bonchosmolovskayae]GIW15109.1 MAG: hypothetical protein KatS3mg063_0962 [Tepidiforma sp.]
MAWFRRRPRITDDIYGRLMTSFGRVVDRDPMVKQPAAALAERVAAEFAELVEALDAGMYRGATLYHLRLLAGAWIMAREGAVPRATAEVFEEALAWRFEPVRKGSRVLAQRLTALANGEFERDTRL